MKIKPTKKRGGVVVELGPNEARMPEATLFRIKRVVVPTDFSDCSRKALAYAVPFAKQFGAEIVLVYVVPPYVPVPEMTAVDFDAIVEQARRTADAELLRLRASIVEEVVVDTVVRVGRPDVEIVRAADDLDADLILLSTHGRTGLGRVFLGSVAEHVTRYAHCPVLTVREKEHEFGGIPALATNRAAGGKLKPISA